MGMLSFVKLLRILGVLQLSRIRLGVRAYPVIVQVEEESERCFRFNVPGHDEGHFAFILLPGEDEIHEGHDDFESWYVDQLHRTTKLKTENGLPSKLPDEAPSGVMEKMSKYLQDHGGNDSKVRVLIADSPKPKRSIKYSPKYFVLQTINSIQKQLNPQYEEEGAESENLEGYRLCITNDDDARMVHVVFDLVLNTEEVDIGDEDGTPQNPGFEKEKHLTPLERSLEQSISAANAVVREMKYMESREARMRQTAESINARVRWFSYLSVVVLLAVTYVQITYLKRYFRKKKLM